MEPIGTAISSGIAGKIAEYSVGPIKRQVDYVIHCKSNLAQLEKDVNDLTDARGTIERRIAAANAKGAIILEEVNKWVEQVEAVTREANQLKDESRAVNLNCVNGCCLNLRMRRQLSKQSIELMKEIASLIRKKDFPEIAIGYHREEVAGIPTGDYMPFDSRESAAKQVMDELKNPNSVRIGVCGIGGVGKTTLVEQVFRKAKQDTSLFDKVAILFDVKSIQEDLEGIQKQIVEKLEMGMVEGETIVTRGGRLCSYINKGKKILIILDDVQTTIDLKHLGVPGVATCKILLISRIPISGMRTDKGFKLDILPEEEAWELFENKADVLHKDPAIQTVAKQVAKKCGRLPVLVVTVASSLKDRKSLPAWENALRCLKEFHHKDKSSEQKAHSTIEWSYNQLDDSMLKNLFLLCGTTVRGNRIFLEDLFKYTMGLRVFENVRTVEHTRNAFYSKVEELKDFCLLIDGEDDTSVRMHDIVRDTARHIALRDHQMLSAVEDGGDDQSDGKGWPNKELTEKCTTISFPSANNIPEVLQCPALKMFLLQGNYDKYMIWNRFQSDESLKILPEFFKETKQLRVLSLGEMRIPSLPSSLQFLNKLQTLCLHKCRLRDLSLVGQLNNLEILSLEGSDVEQLPKEIGQLTRLRLLDLSNCYRLRVVSPGVISSLKRLEELRMRASFNNWKAAGDGSNAGLFELNDLSQLTALEVNVPNADILPADFFSHELKRFEIMIGDEWYWNYDDDRTLNTLKLKLTTTSIELERGLKKLLKICDDLSLCGTDSVNNIVHQLDSQGCPRVRHLRVRDNVDFEYIREKDVLTFLSLTTLTVNGCHRLSFLFSSSVAKSLAELKYLNIYDCKIMEMIVECGQENMDNMFSKLEDLKLSKLPELTRFCSDPGMLVTHWPLLERLEVSDCGKVESIAAELSSFREKHKLNPQAQKSLFLIDKDVLTFMSLTTLRVDGCHHLTFLFSFSMAKSLAELKHLDISDCEIMEVIVECGQENMDNMFSKLEDLNLSSLPKLTRFCSDPGMLVTHWPLLKTLEVSDCSKVESFAAELSSVREKHKLNPQTQQSLFLIDKDVLTFMSLTTLRVHGCHCLSFLFSFSVAKSLAELKHLDISDCEIMEMIVECGQENMDNMFSKLEDLNLRSLPKLTRFCSDPGMLVTHWPLLKTLKVSDCGKVESFAAELSSFREKHKLNPQTQQSLFLIDKDVLTFMSLTTLSVHGCHRLSFLFSFSVAKSLTELKHLDISDCEIMEMILECGQENMDNMFSMFSKLEDLNLRSLPKLTRFCSDPGMLVTHWPFLKTLEVSDCGKVESFAAESHELNPRTQQSLFLIDKSSFPNLEYLKLGVMEIWNGPHPAELVFGKLKYINLLGCCAPSVLLLATLFPNLESIGMSNNSYEKIFVNEGNTSCGEIHAVGSGTLPHVRQLTLYGSDVLHLGNSQSAAGPLFPNLQILGVEYCHKLKNLESSTISFQNLITLEVLDCDRLEYLMSYSVAKNLVQLTRLEVHRCKSVAAIVQASNIAGDDDDDAAGNEIAFSSLQHLTFFDLPSIQGFCSSENCIVKFPSSVTLDVHHCPIKLNISPDGVLLTEKSRSRG